jgi:hypothetical protein
MISGKKDYACNWERLASAKVAEGGDSTIGGDPSSLSR